MKVLVCVILIFVVGVLSVDAQRKLPAKSKEREKTEKQTRKNGRQKSRLDTELRWDSRTLQEKSKGYPEISAWHTGTAGMIASDAAEISLFNPTRIGFSKKTELLFRIAGEPVLPNVGLKHLWWENKRFALATEHSLYYTYPGLKILQHTGFKHLIPDSVPIGQGIAMCHELLFSWLINPRIWGCPDAAAEKILTLRVGTEFYVDFSHTRMQPFDYAHLLYHTQLLDGKVLYYGGLQFDSYFGSCFHYSLNSLFYSVDFKKEYAVEANLRLTCYVSRRFGISVAGKGAYMNLGDQSKFACIPLLDLTYLMNPGRSVIRHGLSRKKNRHF